MKKIKSENQHRGNIQTGKFIFSLYHGKFRFIHLYLDLVGPELGSYGFFFAEFIMVRVYCYMLTMLGEPTPQRGVDKLILCSSTGEFNSFISFFVKGKCWGTL